ncbi:MAG: glycosyltransferase [Ruminococcaceae bacterium]|nr:glycosyltransferase [Oscillospiraceae bacterium]
MPSISVITPLHNAELFLTACIDSVLAQSFKDIELILVDDGSTDGSAAICDAYAKQDRRIKVLRQDHRGVSAARNAGLDAAAASLVSFVDADDTIAPNFLESLLATKKKCKADIALCGYEWVDENGTPIGWAEPVRAACMDSDSALNKLFFHDISKPATVYTSACNKLYTRAIFGDIRFPKGRIFEDYAVMYQLMAKARAVAADAAVLYFRRRHKDSILYQNTPQHFYDRLTADSELIEFARQDEYVYLLPFALQSFWNTFAQNQHTSPTSPPTPPTSSRPSKRKSCCSATCRSSPGTPPSPPPKSAACTPLPIPPAWPSRRPSSPDLPHCINTRTPEMK